MFVRFLSERDVENTQSQRGAYQRHTAVDQPPENKNTTESGSVGICALLGLKAGTSWVWTSHGTRTSPMFYRRHRRHDITEFRTNRTNKNPPCWASRWWLWWEKHPEITEKNVEKNLKHTKFSSHPAGAAVRVRMSNHSQSLDWTFNLWSSWCPKTFDHVVNLRLRQLANTVQTIKQRSFSELVR